MLVSNVSGGRPSGQALSLSSGPVSKNPAESRAIDSGSQSVWGRAPIMTNRPSAACVSLAPVELS